MYDDFFVKIRCQKIKKSTKIVKIFRSSERFDKFQWHFLENVAYNNVKSHKIAEIHPSFRKSVFEKALNRRSNWIPSLFSVKGENFVFMQECAVYSYIREYMFSPRSRY